MHTLFYLVYTLGWLLTPSVARIRRYRSDLERHHLSNTSDVEELYFTQRLDHFRNDRRTFQQRYFYSSRHVRANANQTLALLCVGGEGPVYDKTVLVDSIHCTGDMLEFAKESAQEYSIHLYALEHRYYGESYPDFGGFWNSPVSNHNLVYLSSRQAIADLARFVAKQLLPPHTRWITFGGSYPGMISAWARLRLPHQIAMAVSSSAPVQPVLDFVAFNGQVARAWKDPLIAGSEQCLSIIESGHQALAEAAQNVSLHKVVADMFGLCHAAALNVKDNIQIFLGDGVMQFDMQDNDPSCQEPLCNVQSICDGLMNQTASNYTSLEALAWYTQQKSDGECQDLDWSADLEYIADPIRGKRNGLRSWLWQTCTEFGFYQTCERNSTCPFAKGWHPLGQDLQVCEQAFDVEPRQVAENIQETIDYYGGWHLAATRVLSIAGSVDPWSELALQKSQNTKDRPVYRVPGASHHFWTHPVKKTDGKAIQEAREIIFTTLRRWLADVDAEDQATVMKAVK